MASTRAKKDNGANPGFEAKLWVAADARRNNLDAADYMRANFGDEEQGLFDRKHAFIESDLPIRVDVMDWARIPASFHGEIERARVVVQEGKCGRKCG
jgi:hypothetical protein